MKSAISIFFIVFLFPFSALAQIKEKEGKINLWGYVVDSFRQTGLEGAKVTLMTADSTVVDSIRTYPYDGNALFHFSLPAKTQNIILRAEQTGYEPSYVSMKVKYYKREKEVYAPWINLKKKSHVLEQSIDEVVVTASKVQLVWHGDTLVYNADAFNVPQGSMLDGLIRQLPGVTLKENGEILVNGRRVDYLTLNGTDFFKGNNKMMLDNLPYYTVKNIKVYDKSTDVSQFLGYDAERKDYVMDVVLKREYSVGLTANVEAGGGTAERWIARLWPVLFGPFALHAFRQRKQPERDRATWRGRRVESRRSCRRHYDPRRGERQSDERRPIQAMEERAGCELYHRQERPPEPAGERVLPAGRRRVCPSRTQRGAARQEI